MRKIEPVWYFGLIPIVVILVLNTIGFDGLYGQDSYEYLRYANRLREFMLGGAYPGNLFWPKGYLFLVASLSFVFPTALAGQIVSLVCLYGAFIFFVKIIKQLYPSATFKMEYSILAFLLAPYVFRLGLIVMSDTLAILCLLGTAYYALSYSKTQSMKSILLACFFASFGAFSRYAVIIPILPLVVWLIVQWVQKPKWIQLLVLIVPAILFPIHLFFEGQGSDFVNHHFIDHWKFENLFKNEFITDEKLQLPNESYKLPNLLYYLAMYLYPGFFFLIGITFLFTLKKLWGQLKAFPLAFMFSTLFYSIFLSGITYQSTRYLVLGFPLFAIFAYPNFEAFMNKLKPSLKRAGLVILIVLQVLLFCRAMYPTYKLNKLERELSIGLKPYENNVIYSFDIDISLQQRNTEIDFKSLWIKEYKQFELGALVLFNEPQIAAKFSGKNPMINWNKLNESYRLELIEEFPQGWELYRINE